jgi:putative ABC transport system permease protein
MNKLEPKRRLRPSDLLRLSFQSLGANKLRTGLTVLGIAIGVFSVVGVMTALSAIRESIDSGLSFLAANVVEVRRDPAVQMGGPRRWSGRPAITPRQAQQLATELEREYGLVVSFHASSGGQRIRYGERQTSPRIQVIGGNEHLLATQKYEINYGRMLVPEDLEFNRPVVIIGSEVEDELFPTENPLGKDVLVGGSRFTVVGVLVSRGSLFGSSMDNVVVIPATRFVARFWHPWRSMNIGVVAPSAAAFEDTSDTTIGTFRRIRGLPPERPNDFEIVSNESLQEAFAKIAVVVGTGGLIISAIALVCAGIGIMNIMLVSVTERTREIGLRKSIGARRRDILGQFLLEAVFLSLFGCVVGIALGWGVGNAIAAQMGVPMIVPWLWIGVALLTCVAIGVGFGFFPALRAARLHPIEALRYE